MRRTSALILAVAIVSALAWGKNTTWTNGAADQDFTNAANWSNGVAVNGDTVDSSTSTTPTANRPGAGTTLNVSVSSGVNLLVYNFLAAGGAIGDVTVGHASAFLRDTVGHGPAGDVTVTAGRYGAFGAVGGDVSIASGATFLCMGAATVGGAVSNAGTIEGDSKSLAIPAGSAIAGTGTIQNTAAASPLFVGEGGADGGGNTNVWFDRGGASTGTGTGT